MSASKEFDPIAYINTPRWQQSRLGLDRIRMLLDRMGNPQNRLRFVHVAGTNGKGSTCAYLASILQKAGFKTGLFTSPYIVCFEERIRVNGENISLDDLREATLFVRKHAEDLARETGDHPTEFELMTAVAFQHFAQSCCDIVVAEVGLGGRLDSTNVIERPEACVITRIGLDHTALLGSTVAEVAGEKAGIIKMGVPVICYPQDQEAIEVVERIAKEKGCPLTLPDMACLSLGSVDRSKGDALRSFTYKGASYVTKLLGSYQPCNAALALETIEALRERGWSISHQSVCEGIASTTWPGRFEVLPLPGAPEGQTLIIDGGHNPQGASVLAESLRDVFPNDKPVFVCGVLADKDYEGMLPGIASLARAFVCVTPDNPRALQADDLARAARCALGNASNQDAVVQTAASMAEALRMAREIAGECGIVCVFGSLYQIADVKDAVLAVG